MLVYSNNEFIIFTVCDINKQYKWYNITEKYKELHNIYPKSLYNDEIHYCILDTFNYVHIIKLEDDNIQLFEETCYTCDTTNYQETRILGEICEDNITSFNYTNQIAIAVHCKNIIEIIDYRGQTMCVVKNNYNYTYMYGGYYVNDPIYFINNNNMLCNGEVDEDRDIDNVIEIINMKYIKHVWWIVNKQICYIDNDCDVYAIDINTNVSSFVCSLDKKYDDINVYNNFIYDKYNITYVNFNTKTCYSINYPLNISFAHMDNLNNFIWKKSTHKFIPVQIAAQIKIIVMCNKYLGPFKIPYYLLCIIFSYIVNKQINEN